MIRKEKSRKAKKGLSPVVSTILLIVIVIIIAIIIFLWARRFIGEIGEKEILGVRKSVDKFCPEVKFEASVETDASGDKLLYMINTGDVPIYELSIKQMNTGTGTSIVRNLTIQLEGGSTYNPENEDDRKMDWGYNKIVIIPVLLGETSKTRQKYTCEEEFGVEIEL